jgi:sodium-coupled neutral amino acid transporter 10
MSTKIQPFEIVNAQDVTLLTEGRKRSLSAEKATLARTFSKMRTGSLRGSIFTLCLTAVGPEYLFSAAMLGYNGLSLGLLVIGLSGFVSRMSLNILVRTVAKTQIYEYSKLVEHYYSKAWATLLEVFVITYELGMLIGLQVVLSDILPVLLGAFGVTARPVVSGRVSIVLLNLLVMTPLSMCRSLSSLQYISLSGILGICYVTLVTCAEFPFFYEEHGFEGLNLLDINGEFLVSVPICLSMYFSHTNICTVQGELENSSKTRMYKVTFRMTVFLVFINLLLGLFGYLSTLDSTGDISITRKSPESLGKDWANLLGIGFMVVTFVSAVPVNMHPIRSAMTRVVLNNKSSQLM